MAVHLHSAENSKNIVDFDNLPEERTLCPSNSAEIDNNLSALDSKEDKIEPVKVEDPPEDTQFSKTLNVREVHETSPFKQAVKGFVLNKLSKKVGSSHILSGLTEKIVKKLEEKDNIQPVLVHNSESDLSLRVKEPAAEIISTSISCELKSVVANDLALSEVLNIDDATECFEESKSLVNDIDIGLNIPRRIEIRSNSISLPSSPAHRFNKRASSVSSSLENVESTKILNPNLFLSKEKPNTSSDSKLVNFEQDEIELKEVNREMTTNAECGNSESTYLNNVYSGATEDVPKFKTLMLKRFFSIFSTLKDLLTSLSLSQFFLMTSVLIHNIDIFSSYLAFAFDGLVIAYIFYTYICVLLQKPIPNATLSFPFTDPHLENASIYIQRLNKGVKGSVKVLKGEYDPEMVKNHTTDLIDLSIEDNCLKIFTPKKKNIKDTSSKSETFASYNLLGATISIIPKDLSKKRIWNKKYPICIALPVLKKPNTPDSPNDVDTTGAEYLSSVYCEASTSKTTNQKALYIFALTDREKESLFWALQRNTEDGESKVKCKERCVTPSKFDFTSMRYISLLELNNDDSLSPNKDTYEDDNLSIADKINDTLDFDKYIQNLFENFEKMNKFASRSRSYDDLSNFKEDSPKTSDFISKDDTFLSGATSEFSVDWLNLAIGRFFYDFLTQRYWSDDVKARIQKKLDKIELPTFIESLEVSDVFLGTSLPQIHTVSSPVTDVSGVWFNFDFNYCGSFQMTLKTKLKMTKAKQLNAESMDGTESKQSIIAASSESDDETKDETKVISAKKKKLINRIEKWISYKHFQTVAQSKFVKKYVGDLSNMPLTLTVELNSLHGTLTINIPPAPTDRIWYGFRKDPVLSLNAYPKVGTHEINLSAVVQQIEKKLIQEFKKALVMPNMDDLLIPVMYTPIYDF